MKTAVHDSQQLSLILHDLLHDLHHEDDFLLCHKVLEELCTGLNVFRPYQGQKKVSFFGSAQLSQNHASCLQVKSLAHMLAKQNFMIITGGGEGVMHAANAGAGTEHSFAINIELSADKAQPPNQVVAGSPRYFSCYYFFLRKFFFLRESHAVVLAEGGFGTLDETFETLTLLQTGRMKRTPVVFLEAPHGHFWDTLIKQWMPQLLEEKLIHSKDTKLFLHTDNLDVALQYITEVSTFD